MKPEAISFTIVTRPKASVPITGTCLTLEIFINEGQGMCIQSGNGDTLLLVNLETWDNLVKAATIIRSVATVYENY